MKANEIADGGKNAQGLPSGAPKDGAITNADGSPANEGKAPEEASAPADPLKDMLAADPEAQINDAIAKEKELADTTAAAAAAKAACEELKKELAADPSPEKQAALGPKLAEAEKEAA